MWFGLDNVIISYAGNDLVLVCIPSPNMRSGVLESHNGLKKDHCMVYFMGV